MSNEIQVPIDSLLIKKIALRFGSEDQNIVDAVEACLFYAVMHYEDIVRFYNSILEGKKKRGEIVVWQSQEKNYEGIPLNPACSFFIEASPEETK